MSRNEPVATNIRDSAQRLAADGVAIVLLRERSKRPILNNWTTLPRMSADEVSRRWKSSENIGIRLGAPSEVRPRRFVHGIDMDIRVAAAADEAWDALLERFPEAERWPRVISGSGGASAHLYVFSDAPFRKVNIARSTRTIRVQTPDGPRDKPEWEIDFYGTGAQMVLPPSIHPDTGKAYRWDGDEPDFTDLPFVRQTTISKLFAERAKRDRRDVPVEPLDNLQDIFDTCELDNTEGLHYDDWRDAIFAVKQEYDGTDDLDAAFQILEEWSSRSPKHDQKRFEEVWDHARTDREGGITLGTFKKRVAPELDARRKDRIVDEMEDERPRAPDGSIVVRSPEEDNWFRNCVRDGAGELVNCPENRLLFLKNQHPMEYLVWAEEEQRPVWRRPEEPTDAPALRDLTFPEGRDSAPYDTRTHYQVLQMCLRKKPFYLDAVKKEELNDSVFLAAQQRPWRRLEEMLTREKWDGVRRVDALLQDYLGAADSEYMRFVSRLLVLGPMCRVLWPAVKVDFAPIFESVQGTGKDSFLEKLCTFDDERFYTASTFDMAKPAEYVQVIRGKLIVHLAEMATFRKTSIEQVKTFLTEHEDTTRLSYDTMARTYRRFCVFVFSTNAKGGYLTDNTGNRRFLPVEIGDPKPGPDGRPTAYRKDFRELERDRGQIWAEAYEMAMDEAERQGGRVRELLLTGRGLEMARELQLAKMAETPEMDIVARGRRLVDVPVPLDDLLDEKDRSEKTARQMARRNQIAAREFWVDVLGEKRDQWYRNSQLTSAALDSLPGWERVAGTQVHRGEDRAVYRRIGTDGTPTVVDDILREDAKVIRMSDERTKRRRDV